MKKPILTLLRDRDTTIEAFRRASDQIGTMLSFEAADALEREELQIETPLASTKGYRFKRHAVLIPVMRAGIALLIPFLRLFTSSSVGFVGIRRDEQTALPHLYYKNLPEITAEDIVIILDPMIATGGSGSLVIQMLKEQNIPESHMIYVGVIAAPEGIASLEKAAPGMKIICAEVDERLNDHKFIVPGLGDFGDRYFGT